jgi:hypothetical protein
MQPTDFTAAAVKSFKGQQYYRYQSQMGLVCGPSRKRLWPLPIKPASDYPLIFRN